uniref:hypothetical protein n=1 Tax=Candidatus Electronema sp. TaxID=2698783 RepID=UPI004057C85F
MSLRIPTFAFHKEYGTAYATRQKKIAIKKQDNSYVDVSYQERIAFVWELTADV